VGEQLKALIKTGAAVKKWKKIAGKSKDRLNRLKELVITEKDYQSDLITIRDRIMKELQAAGLITSQEAKWMFPNIDGMIDLSAQIYQEFKELLNHWQRRTTIIGLPMIKYSRFLILYSDFFKNLTETQNKLKALLAKHDKARRIEKALSTPSRIVTFDDLISKPFQRPLKYHLILRDYWSKTEKGHPDEPHLKQAIDLYHKVNEQNNLSVENKEKDQTMMNLDFKFGNIIES
jgi:hypothetical protein